MLRPEPGRRHLGRIRLGVTFEEARAQFPVLEKIAYLNAGTFGPVSRATYRGNEQRSSNGTTARGAAVARTSHA